MRLGGDLWSSIIIDDPPSQNNEADDDNINNNIIVDPESSSHGPGQATTNISPPPRKRPWPKKGRVHLKSNIGKKNSGRPSSRVRYISGGWECAWFVFVKEGQHRKLHMPPHPAPTTPEEIGGQIFGGHGSYIQNNKKLLQGVGRPRVVQCCHCQTNIITRGIICIRSHSMRAMQMGAVVQLCMNLMGMTIRLYSIWREESLLLLLLAACCYQCLHIVSKEATSLECGQPQQ